jgi:hypothetical protein
MLHTYKPSSWGTLSIKKPHQNPLGSCKDIGTDSGKRLCFIPCDDDDDKEFKSGPVDSSNHNIGP